MTQLPPQQMTQLPPTAHVWEGHICPDDENCQLCHAEAWDCSAAIAFGLMGMAEALRQMDIRRRVQDGRKRARLKTYEHTADSRGTVKFK